MMVWPWLCDRIMTFHVFDGLMWSMWFCKNLLPDIFSPISLIPHSFSRCQFHRSWNRMTLTSGTGTLFLAGRYDNDSMNCEISRFFLITSLLDHFHSRCFRFAIFPVVGFVSSDFIVSIRFFVFLRLRSNESSDDFFLCRMFSFEFLIRLFLIDGFHSCDDNSMILDSAMTVTWFAETDNLSSIFFLNLSPLFSSRKFSLSFLSDNFLFRKDQWWRMKDAWSAWWMIGDGAMNRGFRSFSEHPESLCLPRAFLHTVWNFGTHADYAESLKAIFIRILPLLKISRCAFSTRLALIEPAQPGWVSDGVCACFWRVRPIFLPLCRSCVSMAGWLQSFLLGRALIDWVEVSPVSIEGALSAKGTEA